MYVPYKSYAVGEFLLSSIIIAKVVFREVKTSDKHFCIAFNDKNCERRVAEKKTWTQCRFLQN